MLTNYYTVAPVCTASRSSFMSGMYPHFTGSDTNNGAMNLDVTTFAQVLQEAEYAASLVIINKYTRLLSFNNIRLTFKIPEFLNEHTDKLCWKMASRWR